MYTKMMEMDWAAALEVSRGAVEELDVGEVYAAAGPVARIPAGDWPGCTTP